MNDDTCPICSGRDGETVEGKQAPEQPYPEVVIWQCARHETHSWSVPAIRLAPLRLVVAGGTP